MSLRQLVALGGLDVLYRGIEKSVDQSLSEAATAFVANVDRVVSLSRFAPLLLGLWRLYHWQESNIETVHHAVEAGRSIGTTEPVKSVEELIERWKQKGHQILFGPWPPNLISDAMVHGSNALTSPNPEINDGMRSVLTSCLIDAYTAFETLAGDLWEQAVNARPALAPSVNISTTFLQKFNYTVPDKLGTVLRELKLAKFASLEDIRTSYRVAFTQHADLIHAAVGDKSLDALAVARNVIVHKAGVCDKEYQDRARGLAQLPKLEIGEPLPVTGQLVKQLIDPAILRSRTLIECVGQWLLSHPK
jgi:hypothetical protein